MSVLKKIQIDWKFNIGEIVAVLTFALGGLGAYYDLKSDVRALQIQQAKSDTEFQRFVMNQKELDLRQDTVRDQVVKEVKDSVRDSKNDITQEIRDLRSDFMRSQTPRR